MNFQLLKKSGLVISDDSAALPAFEEIPPSFAWRAQSWDAGLVMWVALERNYLFQPNERTFTLMIILGNFRNINETKAFNQCNFKTTYLPFVSLKN